MTDDHLTDRLRELGTPTVPDDLRRQHLARMDASAPAPPAREKRFGRLAVAAAAIVGFLAGSTGLAMAGALPGPAQGVAHDVLSVVQVDVPDHPQNHGACVSAAAKTTDPQAKKAAIDACKTTAPPGRSTDAPGRSGDAPGRSGTAGVQDDPCKGKPPWAGQPGLDAQTRTSMQEQHRIDCPARDATDDQETEAGDTDQPETETPDAGEQPGS